MQQLDAVKACSKESSGRLECNANSVSKLDAGKHPTAASFRQA
jgi:hypothetical protein